MVEGIGRSRRRRLVIRAAERAKDPGIIEKLEAAWTDPASKAMKAVRP